MKDLLLPVTAALLAAAAPASASQAPPPAQEEVSIPFLGFGALRNFRPEGDDIVYFEGTNRRWYRATLNGPCRNLQSALRIAVDARYSGGTLDNSSTLVVDGERCRIMSLVRSEEPPRRRSRR